MRSRDWIRLMRAVAFAGTAASGSFACGNGDDNVAPVPVAAAATSGDAGDGGAQDATVMANDGCVSDTSTCGSCPGPDGDPSNVCSAFTGGCIPFDAARVPTHPTL
jgi:hypothetical protein